MATIGAGLFVGGTGPNDVRTLRKLWPETPEAPPDTPDVRIVRLAAIGTRQGKHNWLDAVTARRRLVRKFSQTRPACPAFDRAELARKEFGLDDLTVPRSSSRRRRRQQERMAAIAKLIALDKDALGGRKRN